MAHVRDLEQIQRFRDRLRDWLGGSDAPDFRLTRLEARDLILWLDDALQRWDVEANAHGLWRERRELGRLPTREAGKRLRSSGVLRSQAERNRERDLRLARLWAELRAPGAMVATAEYDQRLGALPPGELEGDWVTATAGTPDKLIPHGVAPATSDPDGGVIEVGTWTESRSLEVFGRIAGFENPNTARSAIDRALRTVRAEWTRRLADGESPDQIEADLGIARDLKAPTGWSAEGASEK